MAWKNNAPSWQWGIVTAGHITAGLAPGDLLTLRKEQHSGASLPGRLLVRSSTSEHVDCCLFHVEADDLKLHDIVDVTNPPSISPHWDTSVLVEHLKTPNAGFALWPFPEDNPFLTGRYYPESKDLVPALGNLSNCFFGHADGSVAGPFQLHTSGSPWVLNGIAAAIQVAYDPSEPLNGFAQFLETQIAWVIGKLNLLTPGYSVQDFRFVAVF